MTSTELLRPSKGLEANERVVENKVVSTLYPIHSRKKEGKNDEGELDFYRLASFLGVRGERQFLKLKWLRLLVVAPIDHNAIITQLE